MDSISGFLTARSLKYEGLLTTQLLCLVVGSVAVTVSSTQYYTLQKLECRNYRSRTLQIQSLENTDLRMSFIRNH
jgi:hypothetical protein